VAKLLGGDDSPTPVGGLEGGTYYPKPGAPPVPVDGRIPQDGSDDSPTTLPDGTTYHPKPGKPAIPVKPGSPPLIIPVNQPSKVSSTSTLSFDPDSGESAPAKYTTSANLAQFERYNIKLDNGEYVGQGQYERLTASQREYLKANGVSAFNAKYNPPKTAKFGKIEPEYDQRITDIAKELKLPPDIIMMGASIAIPSGAIAGASPEPVSKGIAIAILAGLVTAYGARLAYLYFEESRSQTANDAAKTARDFEQANGRPISPADIVYATSTGVLFSADGYELPGPGQFGGDNATLNHTHNRDQYAIPSTTGKDQYTIPTTRGKDQYTIPTSHGKSDYRIKPIVTAVLVGHDPAASRDVIKEVSDYDDVARRLLTGPDWRRGRREHIPAGKKPRLSDSYSHERGRSGYRRDRDMEALLREIDNPENAAIRHGGAYAEFLKKRAALWAAWLSYVQSVNPSPLYGNTDPSLIQKAALYAFIRDLNRSNLSAQAKAEIIAELRNLLEKQAATQPVVSPSTQTTTSTANLSDTQPHTDTRKAELSKTKSITKGQTQTQSRTKDRTRASVRELDHTRARELDRELTKPLTRTAAQTLTHTQSKVETPDLSLEIPKGEEKFTDEDYTGSISWRQGELNGKAIYYILKPDYKHEKDVRISIGRIPRNAIITAGRGSAYRSLSAMGDNLPSKVAIDMGAQDVLIRKAGDEIRIDFRPDPKGKTRGDITIGRRTLARKFGSKKGNRYPSQNVNGIIHTKIGAGTVLSRKKVGG
jgi:hypothetical protein